MLGKISQAEKYKYCMISLYEKLKKIIQMDIYNKKEMDSQIQRTN